MGNSTQGPLARTYRDRRERLRQQSESEPFRLNWDSTLPMILVELHAVALDFAKGGDAALGGLFFTWMWRRRRPKPVTRSAFEDVLEKLGYLYEKEPLGWRCGPTFLHIRDYDVTFLADPGLPHKALRSATGILEDEKRRKKASLAGRPLRWDHRQEKWRPMAKDWAEEHQLQRLVDEVRTGK